MNRTPRDRARIGYPRPMLRRLVLLRHASARPLVRGGSDHERALDEDGDRQAADVARALRFLAVTPDRIYCSDARRTRETYLVCRKLWPELPAAELSRDVYGGDARDVLDVLAATPDGESVVWVIGHNPTMEQLVHELSGRHVGMGTAHAAVLEAELGDWATPRSGQWRLTRVVSPS